MKYTPAIPLTTAVLATSQPVDGTDLSKFLTSARKAAVDPMVLPTALADLVISSEACGLVSIDDELNQLESRNDELLRSASKISTSREAERTAKTLNAVRSALGRSERRLRSLECLLGACLQYMQELRTTIPNQIPRRAMDAASRILKAHNSNMHSDIVHLLLQIQNNHGRVQTQQQFVRIPEDLHPVS